MRKMTLVLMFPLLFGGCFQKSPSQNYQITSETFTTVYLSLVDLSRAGYLEPKDLEQAIAIKNAAKPVLDDYSELVKKDKTNPSLQWIGARLQMFLIDLSAIESKGKKTREVTNSAMMKSLFDAPKAVPVTIPVDPKSKGL